MPELPDIEVYLHCLRSRIVGRELVSFKFLNPFVLRTVLPRATEFVGLKVLAVSRLGKRVCLEFEGEQYIVIHLMISGRFRWIAGEAMGMGKIGHAVFVFETGSLILTEASTKKRASIHLVSGRDGLVEHTPEGTDPLVCSSKEFEVAMRCENRTLKRALTNQHRINGIGNAYSDEILFEARLSPLRLTTSLSDQELARLFVATQETLSVWRDKLVTEFTTKFPGAGDVTAFRPDFAVHGRFGLACPACGSKIQRIQYAENETNYCAKCQNEGRLLADRSLSRLLKDDWPKTLEELEN